jgi:hypothetical protein
LFSPFEWPPAGRAAGGSASGLPSLSEKPESELKVRGMSLDPRRRRAVPDDMLRARPRTHGRASLLLRLEGGGERS